jgi:energy-coupling factor transporter ATP-binding protein EcfA2
MATEIFIKNFQSLKDVNFVIDGFTVVVGKNNIGKSAIVRAIDAALTNEAGDAFIRNGESKTEVRIKRKDIDIQWEKGDSASYKVKVGDGKLEPYTKLNRAIPKPLLEAGFDKIQIEDKMVSPLIASQFEPLFLLNKRGSVITEVLTALYDMDLISIADDLCQKDLKSQRSIIKTREKDLSDLQAKLLKFKDFEAVKAEVTGIVEEEKFCIKLQAEINQLVRYEEEIQFLEKSLKVLESLKGLSLPDISECEKMIGDIQWLTDKEIEFITSSENYKKLKEVEKIEIPTTTETEALVGLVGQLKKWDEEIEQMTKAVENHKAIIDTLDIENLTSLQSDAEIQLLLYTDIKTMEEEFLAVATTAKATREELRVVTEEFERKQKEKDSKKVCPLCERPL